ncbi:hypothetical protein T05_3965, partial [Trichinella murrelli]
LGCGIPHFTKTRLYFAKFMKEVTELSLTRYSPHFETKIELKHMEKC